MRFDDGYLIIGVDLSTGARCRSFGVSHYWSTHGPVRLLAIESYSADAPWFARVKVVCSPDVAPTIESKHEPRRGG